MKRRPTPNDEGLCDCCFWPMAGDKVRFNGGYAHARCAAEHERAIIGDDAGPGLDNVLEHLDAMGIFLTRLDREAEALGIDRDVMAAAVRRAASHG